MSRKARIIVHTGREAAEPPALAHLLLLLSGVCALLLPAADGLTYSVPRTILLAVSLCVCLWSVARIGWRWAVLCSMLCAALWCAACVLLQDELSVQLTGLVRLLFLTHEDGYTVPFDLAAALTAVFLVLLFFSSELLIGSHVIPYSITLIVFLLGPLLGLQPSVEAAILALLFQFCYWAMNGSGMRQSPFDFALPSRARLTALTGLVMSLTLAVVLLFAMPLALRNDERLYEPAYAAEGFLRRTISRLSGSDATPVTGGNLNRGNQYPTGTTHLILTADRRPTSPVYLRGFSGGEYGYRGWDWNFETELQIFRDMASERLKGWDNTPAESELLMGGIYRQFEALYWRRNAASGDSIRLAVQNGNRDFLDAYRPYYSVWNAERLRFLNRDMDGPVYSFYEQNQLSIDWDAPDAVTDAWIETQYYQHCIGPYTQVPVERLPRLAKLCREHPLTDTDEITAFILHTLQSHASYSLTPGWTPFNRDMVEYFLFDNGLGYCQHFASAATLMYRLYGVPARYATGYIARPEDFLSIRAMLDSSYPALDPAELAEGAQVAFLSDFSAHAWVEIFLPGYGWTPVEVTPAADGSIMPNYPGLNLDLLAQRLAELDFSFPTSDGRQAVSNSQQSLFASMTTGLSRKTRKTVLDTLKALPLLLPIPVVLGFLYHRRRRLSRYARADCRVSFGRLLSMARFAGLLTDCDGQESDFPARLSAAVPGISEADAAQLCRTAEAAAYGPGSIPDEAHGFARELCRRAAESLYGKLNVWKRFLFRWWHAYA